MDKHTVNSDEDDKASDEMVRPVAISTKDFPLPSFSGPVLAALKRGEVDLVWNQVSAIAIVMHLNADHAIMFWGGHNLILSILQALTEAALFYKHKSRSHILFSKGDYANLAAGLAKHHHQLMKAGSMSTFTRALSSRMRSYR